MNGLCHAKSFHDNAMGKSPTRNVTMLLFRREVGFLRSSLAHVMRVRVFSLAPRHLNFEKPACFTNLRTTSASQDKHSTCSSCKWKSNKATLTWLTNILVLAMSKYLVSHNALTYKQRPRALNTTSKQAWDLPHPSIKLLSPSRECSQATKHIVEDLKLQNCGKHREEFLLQMLQYVKTCKTIGVGCP